MSVPNTRSSPVDGAEPVAAHMDESGRVSPDTSLPFKSINKIATGKQPTAPASHADTRSSPIDEALNKDNDRVMKLFHIYEGMLPHFVETTHLVEKKRLKAIPTFNEYLNMLPRYPPANTQLVPDPSMPHMASFPCFEALVPHFAFAAVNQLVPQVHPIPFDTYASLIPVKRSNLEQPMAAVPPVVDLSKYKVPAQRAKTPDSEMPDPASIPIDRTESSPIDGQEVQRVVKEQFNEASRVSPDLDLPFKATSLVKAETKHVEIRQTASSPIDEHAKETPDVIYKPIIIGVDAKGRPLIAGVTVYRLASSPSKVPTVVAPAGARPSSPNTRAAYDTYLMTLPKFNQQAEKAPATVDFSRPVTYDAYLSLVPTFKPQEKVEAKKVASAPEPDAYKGYLAMIPHFAAKASGEQATKSNEPLSYEAYTALIPKFPKTPPSSPTSFDAHGYVATMPTFINAKPEPPKKAAGILSSYESYLMTMPSYKTSKAADDEVASINVKPADRAEQYAAYLQTVPSLPRIASPSKRSSSNLIVSGVDAKGRPLISGVSGLGASKASASADTRSSPIDLAQETSQVVKDNFNEATRVSPDLSLPFTAKAAIKDSAKQIDIRETASSPVDTEVHSTAVSSNVIVAGVDAKGSPLIVGVAGGQNSSASSQQAPRPSTPNSRAAYDTYLMTLPQFKKEAAANPATVDFSRPVTYQSYLALVPSFKEQDTKKLSSAPIPEAYRAYLSMIPHFAAQGSGQTAANEPLSYDAYTKLIPQFPKSPPASPVPFDPHGYVATMPKFITENKPADQKPAIITSYESYLKTMPSYKQAQPVPTSKLAAAVDSSERAEQYASYLHTVPSYNKLSSSPQTGSKTSTGTSSNLLVTGVDAKGHPLIGGVAVGPAIGKVSRPTASNEVVACVNNDGQPIIVGVTGSQSQIGHASSAKPPPDSKCPPVSVDKSLGEKEHKPDNKRSANQQPDGQHDRPIITTTNTISKTSDLTVSSLQKSTKNLDTALTTTTDPTPPNTPEMQLVKEKQLHLSDQKALIDQAAEQLSKDTVTKALSDIKEGNQNAEKGSLTNVVMVQDVYHNNQGENVVEAAIKKNVKNVEEKVYNPVQEAITQKKNVVDQAINENSDKAKATFNVVEDTIKQNQKNVVDEAVKANQKAHEELNKVEETIKQQKQNVVDAAIQQKQQAQETFNIVEQTVNQNQQNVVEAAIQQQQNAGDVVNVVENVTKENQQNLVDAAIKQNQRAAETLDDHVQLVVAEVSATESRQGPKRQDTTTTANAIAASIMANKSNVVEEVIQQNVKAETVKNVVAEAIESHQRPAVTAICDRQPIQAICDQPPTPAIEYKPIKNVVDEVIKQENKDNVNIPNVLDATIKDNQRDQEVSNVVQQTITSASQQQPTDRSRIVESVDLTFVKSGEPAKPAQQFVESVELTFEKVQPAASANNQQPQQSSNGHVIEYPQTESERNADRKLDDAMKDMELKILQAGNSGNNNNETGATAQSLKDIPKFPPVNKQEEAEVERHSQVVAKEEFERDDGARSSRTWPRTTNNVTEQSPKPGRARAASENAKDTITPVPPSTFKRFRLFVRERCTIL